MTKQRSRWLAAGLLVAVSAGCGRVITHSGGMPVYEDRWAETVYELRVRADADFGVCRGRTFTLLERRHEYPVRVAAAGCGSTAIYEHVRRGVVTHKRSAMWTLTTRSADIASPVQREGLRGYGAVSDE